MLIVAGRTNDHLVKITLTTIAAYGSFLIAEHFHTSGVLASMTAGLLAGKGITNRDALADLAVDELTELTGLPSERAQDLIMKARAHWFEDAEQNHAEQSQ